MPSTPAKFLTGGTSFAGIVTGPSAPNRAAAQAISVESAAAAGARARPLILRVARSPPSSRLANSRSFSRLRPMEAAQRTTDRVLVTHAASAALSARARCCARSCVSDARAGLVVLSRGKTFRRGFVDLPACQHRARLRGMQHRHEAWGGRRRFSPQRLSRPAQRRNRNAAHASHVARVHHTPRGAGPDHARQTNLGPPSPRFSPRRARTSAQRRANPDATSPRPHESPRATRRPAWGPSRRASVTARGLSPAASSGARDSPAGARWPPAR
jgi:hypothetical protein